MPERMHHATLSFNAQGTPVADNFEDVYFSNDSGYDETVHVFIAGNDLLARWHSWQSPHYVIAETGFGTGLNCLIAMQLFERFRREHPSHPLKQLFILSTEKYPLRASDLSIALAQFPQLRDEAAHLIAQYPPAVTGCHRLQFAKWSTTLDVWMGDVHDLLQQWHCPQNGLVDSWFLDGFAPSKNPQMWTPVLFEQMARLSKHSASFATFTAAGVVKRGLLAVGFTLQKRKGFGRKRDMLTGIFESSGEPKVTAPWHYRYPLTSARDVSMTESIAIMGTGLAGSSLALALCKRGVRVSLFGKGPSAADGASGNRQGGFYPQLQASMSHPALIQSHGFMFARRHYNELLQQAHFTHDFCGVLLLAFNTEVQKRQQNLLDNNHWPQELVTDVSAQQASELSHLALQQGGLFVPQGGWICPKELVDAQLKAARKTGLLSEHYQCEIHPLVTDTGVTLTARNQQTWTADRLIIASGHDAADHAMLSHLPLRPVRGQVEALPTQPPISELKTVVCHKGYLTPEWNGRHALGSTYVKGDRDSAPRASESEQNLHLHARILANYDWAQTLQHDNQARAGIRLGSADHQPIAGQVEPPEMVESLFGNLYLGRHISHYSVQESEQRLLVLTGLGSRGLTTAPLMAEVIASQLCHEPLPLSEPLLQATAAQRFALRQFKRPPELRP